MVPGMGALCSAIAPLQTKGILFCPWSSKATLAHTSPLRVTFRL